MTAYPHTMQYALVGPGFGVYVPHTENLSDAEVRARAGGDRWDRVERYNRCAECEEWTRGGPCSGMEAERLSSTSPDTLI